MKVAAITVAAMTTVAVCAAPAASAAHGAATAGQTVTTGHTVTDVAPQTYWTPARRAAALDPMSLGTATATAPTAPSTQTGGQATPAATTIGANSSAGYTFPKPGLSKSTTGRLYYTYAKRNWACSATVVSASTKRVLATAAHCLWNVDYAHAWGTNYLFVPDDTNNGASAPYGKWGAYRLWAPNAFIHGANVTNGRATGSGWGYDTGFITMRPLNNKAIQTVTGGEGIQFSTPYSTVVIVGYPSAKPFDGKYERFCSSTRIKSAPAYGDHYIPCAMTQGASGGGWFAKFNRSTGTGYLTGVTSLVTLAGYNPKLIYASNYGSWAADAYKHANLGK